MREQLGGKGANLAELNLMGVPVLRFSQLPQMYATNTTSRKDKIVEYFKKRSQSGSSC